MSEAVVLAKVTCRQCGATFNVRWDDDTIQPIPCPLDGGGTIVKLKDASGAWVEVDQPPAPAPESAPEPEHEEQPQP